MNTPEHQTGVAKIREEGRVAFHQGLLITQNPYRGLYHQGVTWVGGWECGQCEAESHEKEMAEARRRSIDHTYMLNWVDAAQDIDQLRAVVRELVDKIYGAE